MNLPYIGTAMSDIRLTVALLVYITE